MSRIGVIRRVKGGSMRKRGAALVEFAVVLPVLMAFLFGIMEFGHLFKIRLAAQQAAREGCRLAVLQSTQKPYTSTGGPVMQRMSEIMTAAGVTFSPGMVSIVEDTTTNPNVSITITVPYEDVSLTNFLGPITDEITGTCSMRKEG